MSDVQDISALIERLNSGNDVLVIAAMKNIRTLAGQDPEKNQPIILQNADQLIANSKSFYDKITDEKDIRILWQMLHNLCVKQEEFSSKLWLTFSKVISTSIFDKSLELRTKNVISAVVLQLALNGCDFGEDLFKIFNGLLKVVLLDEESEAEFPLLALKRLTHTYVADLPSIVKELDQEERRLLFDILLEEKRENYTPELLQFVTGEFKSRATTLFITMKSREAVDPKEVIQLLEIICSCSHTDEFQGLLQRDKSLLIDALYLLRMIHETGKEDSRGMFGPKPSLDDLRNTDQMSSDPVFGLKRDLVRLIANLVDGHRGNQDEVKTSFF